MSLNKLSLAAVLSISMFALNPSANAQGICPQQCVQPCPQQVQCAPCEPICPQPCPTQQVQYCPPVQYCPTQQLQQCPTCPTGAAAPVYPCAPVQYCPTQQVQQCPTCPTGAAAPICPQCAPIQPCPTTCVPACPQQTCPTPCPTSALPITQFAPVYQQCPTACPTCPTGAAAQPIQMAPVYQYQYQSCPAPCPAPCPTPYNPCTSCAPITGAAVPPMQMSPVIQAPENLSATCQTLSNMPVCVNCPNLATNNDYIKRQVYAYPYVGGKSLVMPASSEIIQLGSDCNKVISSEPTTNITGAAAQLCTDPEKIIGSSVSLGAKSGEKRHGVQVSKVPKCELNRAEQCLSIQSEQSTCYEIVALVPCAPQVTGAAACLARNFNDVPTNLWAKCDIEKLACKGIVAGYPDNSFRACAAITRAEFASLLVSALNLDNGKLRNPAKKFRDVSSNHWAKQDIEIAFDEGLIAGFPDNTFRPQETITKAEALNILAKAIPGKLDSSEAKQILSQYPDGYQVPEWAEKSVAEALKAGLYCELPDGNQIRPDDNITRAEVTKMAAQIRQDLALEEPEPQVTGAAAYVPQKVTMNAPTLSVKIEDQLSSRSSQVGDKFAGKTLEAITINNMSFPKGSRVDGKVVEVIRPKGKSKGALKVAFTEIKAEKQKAVLPQEILSAVVQETHKPNFVARTVQMPLNLAGRVLGIAGRTVGGATIIAGNATEQFFNGVGTAGSELFQGKFRAMGRSLVQGTAGLVVGPFNMARTVFSGAGGIVATPVTEVAYLVNPKGSLISSINPNEIISIAFGCQ